MLMLREDYTTQARNYAAGAATTLEDHLRRGQLRGVEAKDHLFVEGDVKSEVYLVESGSLCLYKVLPDGRRQVIGFAFRGDIVGLHFSVLETCNAQATVATRVKCLPMLMLTSLARREPAIAVRMFETVSEQLTSTNEHLVSVVQRSALERVASFLLDLSMRNEARGLNATAIELSMTRADIADFLGLTIETVSRTLTKLRTLGLISIEQCTSIALQDVAELRRLADGGDAEPSAARPQPGAALANLLVAA